MTLKKIITKIEDVLKYKETIIIAIDGMSASGKTSLGSKLVEYFDANLVHTDDFFLPIHMRTTERLNEPGGNINYEYLNESVIKRLDSDIKFKPFSCKKMDYLEEIHFKKKNITIIEGAYSLHPYFNKYYDVAIFLEVDSNIQEDRILSRNGFNELKIFQDKWIPLENNYFKTFKIKEKADLIINTSMNNL